MNPLTLVKRIQQINSKEAALGISDDASWHAKYKESAYVFVGGIPYDLTEGDLLAVFAQYGEIVDVNLVRDKATGKSKGFCFVAYEDQRSTNLAVDNLNEANVLGRVIRVDHVTKYKKKEEEDEEEQQQKREARGVCRAFQRGDCNRGASCKFSHNEQRAANTGWGVKEDSGAKWEKDKYDGPSKGPKSTGNISSNHNVEPKGGFSRFRSDDKNGRPEENEEKKNRFDQQIEINPRDQDRRGTDKRSERYEKETNHKDWDRRRTERSTRHDSELNHMEDRDNRGRQETSGRRDSEPSYKRDRENRKEKRLGRHESERYQKEDRHHREDEKRTRYDRDSSSHHYRKEETDTSQRSHR